MIYKIYVNYGYGWEWASEYDNINKAKKDLEEYKIHIANYNGKCKLVLE